MRVGTSARSTRRLAALFGWLALFRPQLTAAQAGTSPGAQAQTAQPRSPSVAQPANTPQQQPQQPKGIPTIDVVRANLEPAYIAYPLAISGLDPLIFESNVVAHFVVNEPSWPCAFVLSPKIIVRMFRQYSAPVKTPSYMPRITAYFWFEKMITGKPTIYGSIMLSHHSNGQSGPFFDSQGNINHETGSFSTNYFEFTAYGLALAGRWFGWSALSFEWHPGFNQNPELEGRYGLMRLHLASTVLADLPLKGQLNVRLTAILDRFQHSSNNAFVRGLERFPIQVQYMISLPGSDLGLYASYYFGHDYYNIYFDRLLHTFQIGIAGAVTPALMGR